MRQLVDEAARAIERNDGNDRGDQHPRRPRREDRRRDARIADEGRGEEIGPIDARRRLHEIARQQNGGASGRERGGKYVEVSVVAVTLKKKTEKKCTRRVQSE